VVKLLSCLYTGLLGVLQVDEARDILATVVLAHVPVHQFEFRPKCIYIAVIIRKMLEAMLNTDAVDDKVNC
jgi:DNA-directed RNA polymerase III subunit RPC2